MEIEGNKLGTTYSSHNIETGQGCWEILHRLKFENGKAKNYDSVIWQEREDNYYLASVNSSTVKVHKYSKEALDTCIPLCNKLEITREVMTDIYDMLPWFKNHKAIWFSDDPRKEEGVVAVFETPPGDHNDIGKGFRTYFLAAMNAAALFYLPDSAKFIHEWGNSGKKFKAMLVPAKEILSTEDLEKIQRDMDRNRP